MSMKRIKPIQMQMQPARMDKVLCLELAKSACVCAVLDTEKSASGQSPTQYLSDFCNTILLQRSLKYSGFINPFRTTL